MYNTKRTLSYSLNIIKNQLSIVILTYLIGVIIGAINTDINTAETQLYLNYDTVTYVYRYVFYVLIIYLVSASFLGIPVILYIIYIYGVNNGVIFNLYFTFSQNILKNLHFLIICAVFSVFAVAIIGVCVIQLSKEILVKFFLKNNSKAVNIFLNTFILILIGFSFYYFCDIYKIKLLQSLK